MQHDWPDSEIGALAEELDMDEREVQDAVEERWTKFTTNALGAETAVAESLRLSGLVTTYRSATPDTAAAAQGGDVAYRRYAEERTVTALEQLKAEFTQHAREFGRHAEEAFRTLSNYLAIFNRDQFPGARTSLDRLEARLRQLPR
ncbi:hypothetical protein AB0M48_39025 [Lentzea sp. NPDC051208]|uniref:hypothetical protein n=1 Tax=Lentzea sp. NPDC051208 TaxID=3154642 RepID=UPI00342BBB52